MQYIKIMFCVLFLASGVGCAADGGSASGALRGGNGNGNNGNGGSSVLKDRDRDGVSEGQDCDDSNPKVGRVLFDSNFEDGKLGNTESLQDEWVGGSNTKGGQQALLDVNSAAWRNTVTFAKFSGDGVETKCSNCIWQASGALHHRGAARAGQLSGYLRNSTAWLNLESPQAVFKSDDETGRAELLVEMRLEANSGSEVVENDVWQLHAIFRRVIRGNRSGRCSREESWDRFGLESGYLLKPSGDRIALRMVGTINVGRGANLLDDGFGVHFQFDYERNDSNGRRQCGGGGQIKLKLSPPDRFRGGILARASRDADQDEGFHGYRCAVARNSTIDCNTPGDFVQVAAFLDAPEDNIQSECDLATCPSNTTFDQLARVERSNRTELHKGDAASLAFWVVNDELTCAFKGEGGEQVTARATDVRFAEGGTGVSVLNLLSNFESIKVCEAFESP